jgi:hypothetical protein
MPLPTRNKGESTQAFVSRCMGNPTMLKDFKDQKQRAAVCHSQARKARASEVTIKVNAAEVTHVGSELVFPLIAMTEGVRQAANSEHAELVQCFEIEASAPLWDGFPLTITHPRDSKGNYISASHPEALPFVIGRVTKPEATDGKLKVEAHLDLVTLGIASSTHPDLTVRAEAAAMRNRILDGEQIEVSAGYFTRIEPEEGTWDFESETPVEYSGLQQEIDPDHIALLKTTQQGACSWADGCGAPRMSEGLFVALEARKKPCTCHMAESAVNDDHQAGLRNNETVDRDDSVKPADEEGMMGAEAGGDKDKEKNPAPNPNPPAPEPEKVKEPAATTPEPTKVPEPVAASAKPTFQELLDAADPDLRYSINQQQEQAKERRGKLNVFLKANSEFSEDELRGMTLQGLEKLYKTIARHAERPKPGPRPGPEPDPGKDSADARRDDYRGRGLGLSANDAGIDDDERVYTPLPEPAFKIGSRPELVTRRGKSAA